MRANKALHDAAFNGDKDYVLQDMLHYVSLKIQTLVNENAKLRQENDTWHDAIIAANDGITTTAESRKNEKKNVFRL